MSLTWKDPKSDTEKAEEMGRNSRAEYEANLEAKDRDQLATQTERLRRRLLQLAGYGEGKAS